MIKIYEDKGLPCLIALPRINAHLVLQFTITLKIVVVIHYQSQTIHWLENPDSEDTF